MESVVKARDAAWGVVTGLAVALLGVLPFGWPPWLAILVGLAVALAVAVTLTLVERCRRSVIVPSTGPPSSRPGSTGIRLRNVRGLKSSGNTFVGLDTAWDAEDVEDWEQGEDTIIAPDPPKQP
ncbi:MAG: hypothetical protein JF886_06430 [Candidatus Dormibacteraeota bacterium]|uniref:Uncharacterized protein n=1 Tax=Candidatus Aeolococcus gillhamiae TaxID=3127015 RepID=A0A934JWV6_9BACT|nr:hypothetical protein [Candidatus Dormibacteraeota bacterium]